VLQPAVEAFFLVHGTEKEEEEDKNKVDANKSTGRDPLQSSSSFDVPASPGPYSPGASLSPVGSRHGSQSSSFAHLPADTQKFLRFAGNVNFLVLACYLKIKNVLFCVNKCKG